MKQLYNPVYKNAISLEPKHQFCHKPTKTRRTRQQEGYLTMFVLFQVNDSRGTSKDCCSTINSRKPFSYQIKLNNHRCRTCDHLTEGTWFNYNGRSFTVNANTSCDTKNVIYVTTCP